MHRKYFHFRVNERRYEFGDSDGANDWVCAKIPNDGRIKKDCIPKVYYYSFCVDIQLDIFREMPQAGMYICWKTETSRYKFIVGIYKILLQLRNSLHVRVAMVESATVMTEMPATRDPLLFLVFSLLQCFHYCLHICSKICVILYCWKLISIWMGGESYSIIFWVFLVLFTV